MALINIFGASGCGSTTLARALADATGARHVDTDHIYWLPSDPPYERKRPIRERGELLCREVDGPGDCVVSGSLSGWGSVVEHQLDLAVFLWVPTPVRIARLRAREAEVIGAERIAPGGDAHAGHVQFIEWATNYDNAGLEQRSRAVHEAWMKRITCPVLRIEGEVALADSTARVLEAWPEMTSG
jgi:adenylate kinase family enzyme